MSFLSSNPILSKVVVTTQALIDSPTAQMLADYSAIYITGAMPTVRYQSNGTSLEVTYQTQEEIDELIQANDALGAMAPAVQAIVDASAPQNRDRANHTGSDPASNIVFADGQTLEDWRTAVTAALAGGGASAPIITVAPTIAGSVSVGSTLTATTGSVTEGTGGSHTNEWKWFKTDATNSTTQIADAASTTLNLNTTLTGFRISVSQIAIDSTGLRSNESTSAVTAAVTATVPTNSVAPTITNSGSQVVGTTYGVASLGTWADDTSATVEYQWIKDDADITGAIASTYTSVAGQEGGVIKLKVRKTTGQGSSVWVTSSNSSTVTGTPALTEATAPVFPATLTAGVTDTITNATWTGGTPTLINTRVYVAEGSGGLTTPYVTLVTNPPTYRPETDGNSFLFAQTGLTTLVGNTLYCDQTWSYGGNTYTSSKSAAEVVQAPAAALSARVDYASLSITINQAISTVRPVAGVGGTAPYTYTVSPALPSGLTLNASTGYITGTPTVLASASHTITVTDSAGTPATATGATTITVSAASIPTMFLMNAANPFSSVTASLQTMGSSYTVSGISETNGITGPNVITGSPVASAMRFGKIDDPSPPGGVARKVFYFSGKTGDGVSQTHTTRCEVSVGSPRMYENTTYWFAFEAMHNLRRLTSCNGNMLQIHQSGGTGYGGPLGLLHYTDYVRFNYVVASSITASGTNDTLWYETTGSFPVDVWNKWVFKMRCDGDHSTSSGIGQLWRNGVLLHSRVSLPLGMNDSGGYYLKFGYDDYSSGSLNTAGSWDLIRSCVLVQDNGYTEQQIRDLLT